MQNMFNNTAIFNQDISSWDTSSVVNMQNMLNGTVLFDQDLSSLDISNVTNMTNMLSNSALSLINYDNTLIGWNTQSVQANVTLGSNTLNYCLGETARNNLILLD